MKSRLLSALVLLPVAFYAIYAGSWVYIALIMGFAVIAGWEYTHIANHAGHRVNVIFVWGLIIVWMVWAIGQNFTILPLLLAVTIVISVLWEIIANRQHPSFQEWVYTVGAGIYLGIMFAFMVGLRLQVDGLFWTLVSFPVIWAGDAAAYFVGQKFGTHKWIPAVSPDKTWEGYLAQIVAGTLIGGLFTHLMIIWLPAPAGMTAALGTLLGFVLSVLCPFGDLFISMIKREFEVKDTSHIIPGHGGVLDRLDALLWAGVLTQVFISLLH